MKNIEVRRIDSFGQTSHSVYTAQENDGASYRAFLAGLCRSRKNGFRVYVRYEIALPESRWFSMRQFFGAGALNEFEVVL